MKLGVLPDNRPVNQQDTDGVQKRLPFDSMDDDAKREPTELGARINEALRLRNRTRTSVETAAGLHRGYMSRLITGVRGGTSIDPKFIAAIADELNVSFEWLALGRGPVESGKPLSPVQEGAQLAIGMNALEEAVKRVLARDAGVERDATGWMYAFLAESSLMMGEKIARRPVEKKQEKIRAVSREKKRQNARPATPPSEAPPQPLKRKAQYG